MIDTNALSGDPENMVYTPARSACTEGRRHMLRSCGSLGNGLISETYFGLCGAGYHRDRLRFQLITLTVGKRQGWTNAFSVQRYTKYHSTFLLRHDRTHLHDFEV